MAWIAMELLTGCTLRELMEQAGPLALSDALHNACGIGEGVIAAHDLRIVHRDLKPENVFITRHGQVKVLDFGTAKFNGCGSFRTKGLSSRSRSRSRSRPRSPGKVERERERERERVRRKRAAPI